MKRELLDFLEHHPLFRGIAKEDLLSLLPLLHQETCDPGTFIVKEGEEGDPLYLIKEGSVEVIKEGADKGVFHRLNTLSSNAWFGEISFLGGSQRQASIRALETTEVVSLSLKAVSRLASGEKILSKLSSHFAKQLGSNLTSVNILAIESLQKELQITRLNGEMGRILIYVFIVITVFVYVMHLVESAQLSPHAEYVSGLFVVVCLGVVAFLFLKGTSYPFEFYGITLKQWKQHLKEGIVYTLPVLALMVVLKWWLIHTFDAFKHLEMFGRSAPSGFFLSWFEHAQSHFNHWVDLSVYVALIPIQEFIIRGVIQGCLFHFFHSSYRALLSIVVSNLLFMVFHNLKTIPFSLAAGALGLFWGWLYYKQKSLIGPIVSHALVGIVAFGILDYSRILT